jgi:hypothetical protein
MFPDTGTHHARFQEINFDNSYFLLAKTSVSTKKSVVKHETISILYSATEANDVPG